MKYRMICAALAASVFLTGCASTEAVPENRDDPRNSALISGLVSGAAAESTAATPDPEEIAEDDPEEYSGSDVPSGAQPSVIVPTAEVTTTPDADSDFDLFYSEVHEQFALSDEEMSFVEYSLFVGDSICSGFSEYGIVPHEYVSAKGNLGARSFFEYTFKFRGKENRTYAQVLKTAKPRYVFLSMGMNDVNMVDEETYCENYRKVIDATLEGSNAEVFVAAITPVCSKFCANSVIDSFNDTMRRFIEKEYPERVHFFDFGQYLKNEQGKLRTCLHSGDGVHLGPYCYYIALWEMHRALMEAGLWDGTAPMGTFEAEEPEKDETEPAQTSSKPSQTKPAKTTANSTAKPQTTKPQTTTSKPQTTMATDPAQTTAITTAEPVETAEPTEIPQTLSYSSEITEPVSPEQTPTGSNGN